YRQPGGRPPARKHRPRRAARLQLDRVFDPGPPVRSPQFLKFDILYLTQEPMTPEGGFDQFIVGGGGPSDDHAQWTVGFRYYSEGPRLPAGIQTITIPVP